MHDRSPNAYGLSLTLHVAAIALAVFSAFVLTQKPKPASTVFELVAGQGDNYGATAAPKLGVPGGIKVPIPDFPATPPPAPAAAPEPAQAVAAEPVPAPVAVTPPTARSKSPAKKAAARKPTSLAQMVKSTANWRARIIKKKYDREVAAEQRREMTYEEYLREHPSTGGAASRRSAHLDPEGIRQGVEGGSADNATGGAGGKALTREEGDLMDAYFAFLKNRLSQNIDRPTDVGDKLAVQIGFFLAADGSISHVRVLSSSGNPDFDEAVLEAFRRTRPVGPRPDHHSEELQVTFNSREDQSGD